MQIHDISLKRFLFIRSLFKAIAIYTSRINSIDNSIVVHEQDLGVIRLDRSYVCDVIKWQIMACKICTYGNNLGMIAPNSLSFIDIEKVCMDFFFLENLEMANPDEIMDNRDLIA